MKNNGNTSLAEQLLSLSRYRDCAAGVQERVRREPGTQNACPTCKTAPFIGTDIAALLRETIPKLLCTEAGDGDGLVHNSQVDVHFKELSVIF